jgi:ribonuclease HII
MLPTWDEENRLIHQGYRLIAGIDEVGRGPLAGPVVAAAVILDPDADIRVYDELRDSKTLTPNQRERIAESIKDVAIDTGIGAAEHWEIDSIGIVKATRKAMFRAVATLSKQPHHLLVDAIPLPEVGIPFLALVKGDTRCRSIAAASIVAKVYRDHLMVLQGSIYPNYGFEQNKGYGTKEHIRQLYTLGPSPIHRRTFAPINTLVKYSREG